MADGYLEDWEEELLAARLAAKAGTPVYTNVPAQFTSAGMSPVLHTTWNPDRLLDEGFNPFKATYRQNIPAHLRNLNTQVGFVTPDHKTAIDMLPTAARPGGIDSANIFKGEIPTKELSKGLTKNTLGEWEALVTKKNIDKMFGLGGVKKTTGAKVVPTEMIGPLNLEDKFGYTKTMIADPSILEGDFMPKGGPTTQGLKAVQLAGKAARALPVVGGAMSAAQAADYWGAGKPVRAGLALASMVPGPLGWSALAGETGINAVTDGIQTEDMPVSPTRFGSDEPYAGMGSVGVDTPFSMETTHPGQALGYDLSGQIPSQAGRMTGMDVAVDAGGAVGGYPTMDTDYGTMATEESDYVPSVSGDAGITDIPDLAMTRFERSKLQLPQGQFTPLPDFNPAAFTPYGPTRQVPARIRQTIPTANDPTGGLSATVPSTGFQTVSGTQNVGNQYGTGDKTMQEILDEAAISQGLPTRAQTLIARYGDSSTEVTDDPTGFVPSGVQRPAGYIQDLSRWDMLNPDLSDWESMMPNMEVNQPLDTGIIPASAQVAGTRVPFVNVPSESSYHVSPQTDQNYLDLGVTPPGWDIAHPSESPMLDQRYTDAGYYGDPKGVIEDALAGILGGTINPAEVAVGGPQLSGAFPQYAGNPYGTMATEESDYGPFATPNFAGQQAPYGGPMMDTSLMSGFGKVGENVEEFVHYKDLVDKLVASGAVKAPTGYVSSVDVTNDLALPNIQHAMSSDTYGYQSGLKAALANEILGMGPKTWGTSQDIQELGRKFTSGGATPAMQDAQKQEGTRAINAALANPDISAQATQAMAAERSAAQLAQAAQSAGVDVSSIDPAVAAPGGYVNLDALAGQVTAAQEKQAAAAEQARQEEADAKAAEYMAAAADTQDMMMAGGTLGGGTAPLPAVSAPMAPRQQAMPAAVTPAPTAPTVASVAAQNILAQTGPSRAELELQHRNRVAAQEAQAAIERVAQAQALMSKYGNRDEPAENYMSAAERDIVAAAQVDTFAELGTTGGYEGGSSFAGNVGNYGGMGGFEGYR